MSADNYILIRKENLTPFGSAIVKYVGYDEYSSNKEPSYSHPVFDVFTLSDAIRHAQQSATEYGYRFEEVSLD
tara:strand:- start:7010 stop:7228 length:219 start_codon:yes stop_codon:yes gene_type:complete